MKTAYNTRYYSAAPVSDFSSEFPESFHEDRLLVTVRRADDIAEKLASPGETILVYDDVGAPFPTEFGRDGEPDMGIAHSDVGEMLG